MLYVFSINRVKLAARKPKATYNLGQREYICSRGNGALWMLVVNKIDWMMKANGFEYQCTKYQYIPKANGHSNPSFGWNPMFSRPIFENQCLIKLSIRQRLMTEWNTILVESQYSLGTILHLGIKLMRYITGLAE